MKTIHKKLVNKFYINRKLLIGDQNMLRSITTQSIKDKHSVAKPVQRDKKKTKLGFNSATVVQQP